MRSSKRGQRSVKETDTSHERTWVNFATCNARSLMRFPGLRTQHELAQVLSSPQR
ncbi:hypothetical protein GCM10023083_72310 [Streptomyces phyllanthi]